jgi:Predicted esterase of the alpha/beta hydrolase fold
MHIVNVPGFGGSGPQHWQTAWEQAHPGFTRFAPSSWTEPDSADWSRAIGRAVGVAPAVLVAHSLGCLAAADWARRYPELVMGVLLVAVPDPQAAAFPVPATPFATVSFTDPLGVPALVVASEDDQFCTPEVSARIARGWDAGWLSVGRLGHINSDSDLGTWPRGWDLFTAFAAGLGQRV